MAGPFQGRILHMQQRPHADASEAPPEDQQVDASGLPNRAYDGVDPAHLVVAAAVLQGDDLPLVAS
ncbi:hypothetical protein GCM10009763_24730 [Dermacoccus profundi]|uniref:Uncharacterized protein n=1 Tax=Dermacoccus profundi TaxID=322602 RepID=A0ABN2DGG0_9MICO